MNAENRCPACDAKLAANAPRGLCPDCLLKQGLQTTPLPSGGQANADFEPPTPADLAPHFPDLEILELVGRGGMGMVYKARQKRLDRFVALKILSPKIGQDPAFAERFAREARAMAMLNHPYIVAVYDFGQTNSPLIRGEGIANLPSPATMSTWCPGRGAGGEGGLYYFLMEFVDGLTLRQLLDTGKLAPEEALAIVPQICEALQYAHDKGVVHRDIKPENVLLDKEGRVKIADFGIAKLVGREAQDTALTGAGQIVGTPQYMAPEQIEHPLQVDHRADIYSLGVVFYQMLTGELPIGRFAPPSKKVQIDVRLDEVVLRALEKEPEQRYQQASEFKTEVESIVTTPRNAADRKIFSADPKSPSTGGPWVWADTLAFLGGIVWTSTMARQVANASALGFLGFLGCLGFLPFPGMHRCFGFSGFSGFFGLIGVAVMIEYAARRKAKTRKRALGSSMVSPRLSKTALVGAVWGGPFFLIIILSLCVITLWLTLSINSLFPLLSPIMILLLATPIGVPILGYVALNQIRRSASRLYGLGLALFDLLAFPLLALDAAIAGLVKFAARALASYWSSAAGTPGDLVGVVAVLLIVVACVVIDFLTIRWVWRAVTQPPVGALPADQLKRSRLKAMLSVAAPVLAFVLGVFGFAFLLWSLAERFESAKARIHTCIFEADAELVDRLVPRATRKPGRMEESAVEVPSRAPQTAEVSADVFARLLADGVKEPGLLDEQTREGAWWPKLATSSHYMRHGKVVGEGWVDGFLGIRRHKDVLQLRVEENVMHGMNSAILCATIAWEGSSPPPEAARAFFIPFSRMDGTARYLVIAFEVGNGTENDRGISEVHAEKQEKQAAAHATKAPRQENTPDQPTGSPVEVEIQETASSSGKAETAATISATGVDQKSAIPKPSQQPDAQGPVLTYEVDPASVPTGISASDMDKLLKAVDRRLNSGTVNLARVRKSGDARIEVALLRRNDADRQRVERLLARRGTLEFRILANTHRDKDVIEHARKDPSKAEVLDPSGKRLAWWVPLKAGEEKVISNDPDITRRPKTQDHRDSTEVLVVTDPCNVTGAYLTKAEAGADNISGYPRVNFTFNDAGGKLFAKLTGDHLPDRSTTFSYRLGIILDGELYSAPHIISMISNQGALTGVFSKEQVTDLVDSLNTG